MQCATLTSDTIYFERIKLFFSMFACAGEIRSSLNFPVKQIVQQCKSHLLRSPTV